MYVAIQRKEKRVQENTIERNANAKFMYVLTLKESKENTNSIVRKYYERES